jgi:hypothetical protein
MKNTVSIMSCIRLEAWAAKRLEANGPPTIGFIKIIKPKIVYGFDSSGILARVSVRDAVPPVRAKRATGQVSGQTGNDVVEVDRAKMGTRNA